VFCVMLDLVSRHFSLEELRTLSFDLGVNPDVLGGQGLSGVARELILNLQRRDRLPDLLAFLRAERPSVAWPTDAELASSVAGIAEAHPPADYSYTGRDSYQVGDTSDSVIAIGPGASVVVGKLPKQKKGKKDAR